MTIDISQASLMQFFGQFVYSSMEILLIFIGVVFFIQWLMTFVDVSKLSLSIARMPWFLSHVVAALLGAVTPFCTCSSVPLFIAMVKSRLPKGVAFSFLITSPLVNEIALAMLLSLFGWKITVIYVLMGFVIGVVGGLLMNVLTPSQFLIKAKSSKEAQEKGSCCDKTVKQDTDPKNIGKTCKPAIGKAKSYGHWYSLARWQVAYSEFKGIFLPVWPYILIGMAIGAAIKVWVPASFIASTLGGGNMTQIPFAVLVGMPIYSSIVSVLPIVANLYQQGMSLGVSFALIMSIGGMSFPEWILLSSVLRKRVLFVFIAIVGVAIILTSYLFDFLHMLGVV